MLGPDRDCAWRRIPVQGLTRYPRFETPRLLLADAEVFFRLPPFCLLFRCLLSQTDSSSEQWLESHASYRMSLTFMQYDLRLYAHKCAQKSSGARCPSRESDLKRTAHPGTGMVHAVCPLRERPVGPVESTGGSARQSLCNSVPGILLLRGESSVSQHWSGIELSDLKMCAV
jgi:hypothetical protein